MNASVFLILATEWFSRKGGISTFNRELCRELRAVGHAVYCAVPEAEPDEVEDARASGVELVQCPVPAGAPVDAGLYRRIPFKDTIYPDVIVGHARFTGPAAVVQVQDFYPKAIRLHFVHVAPGEIDRWKFRTSESGAARSESRERIELELAESADLVVAVGPRLYAEYKTLLNGRCCPTPIHQLNPGLVPREPPKEVPPQLRCLMLGRAEDLELKGLDIAAVAISLIPYERLGTDPILVIRGAPAGTGDELLRTLSAIPDVSTNRLRVMEYTNDLQRISSDIRSASVVIMPSRAEGFGLVGLEAISIGIPVLLSQQSGLSSLLHSEIREHAHEVILPVTSDRKRDAEHWANKIEMILNRRQDAFGRARRLRDQLASILSWTSSIKALEEAIRTIPSTQRSLTLLQKAREPTAHQDSLGSPRLRAHTISYLSQIRLRALASIFAAQTRWGPSFFSATRKVANVCEVILSIPDEVANDPNVESKLTEAIQWLFLQQRQGGFPSLSRDTITTHCTALGALACERIQRLSAISKPVRDQAGVASWLAADKCLQLAGDRGWGTWGRGTVRIQPTLLALRALAIHDSHRLELLRRFEQLRALHSIGKPGCFGFQPGTEARVSPTAAFLLLCSELLRLGYSPSSPDRFDRERHTAAQFLLSVLPHQKAGLAEVELYYVDSEHIPLIGHIEQLTWIHVSLPLAVEALARSPDLIDTPRAEEVWFKAALDLASRFDSRSGLLQDAVFSEFGLTEPIFPTTYGCAALASAEEWLRHYKQAPAPELSPPPTTRLIRKAGAAIIEDGRILLVRKFKTDLFIMPGGGVEDGEQIRDALRRELLEELGCRLALIESEPIGVYRAPAAFEAGFEVEITLFLVRLRDRPSPHSEIEEIIWHAPSDDQAMLSPIVKELIIPGLCALKLL